MDKKPGRAALTMLGAILAFAGFLLPWYSVVFDPPGGFMIINGQEMAAFTYAVSGLNPSEAATGSGQFLHNTIIAMLVLGVFGVIRMTLPEKVANPLIQGITDIVQSKFTEIVLDSVKALTHIILGFALVGFFILYVLLYKLVYPGVVAARLGGGAGALQASHYLSVHIGIGLLTMFAGLLVGGLTLWRQVAVDFVILIVLAIILAIFHSPALGQVWSLLGL